MIMTIILPEVCSAEQVAALWPQVLPAVAELGPSDTLTLDADGVKTCDGAGEALIVELFCCSVRQGFSIARQIGRASCRERV